MKNAIRTPVPDFGYRALMFTAGMLLLAFVYLFQRHSFWTGFDGMHPNIIFALNRTARLTLNDLACFLIIFAVFREKKYLKLAFLLFLVELLVILPVYLIAKLGLEGDSEISSPLLSQIHRLIVNPMLMILLMAGFFYQRYVKR